MEARHGAPHVGVAPLVLARRPGTTLEVAATRSSAGCCRAPSGSPRKTEEFRKLYEGGIGDGARAVYDRGIEYLRAATTRAPRTSTRRASRRCCRRSCPLVDALRGEPRCALVFYVFDLVDRSEIGRLRCLHLDATAEVLDGGPVFDNVWWHNALFHGPVDDHVVVHFRHLATWDTRFGALEPVAS